MLSSTCRSRARTDQPPSFVSPAVVEQTTVEAVGDFIGVIIDLVRETSWVRSRRLSDGSRRH
jgi:hypothetical protein